MDATDLKLTDAELQTSNEVSIFPSEYPGWMFDRQNKGRFPG